MVILLQQLPEEASFNTSIEEDWSFARQVQVGILNELRIMRTENINMQGGEANPPHIIKTPRQELAEQHDAEQKKQIRIGIMAQLNQGV